MKKVHVRPAKWSDVEMVFASLCLQNQREYALLGIGIGIDGDARMALFAKGTRTGDTKTMCFDDEPQCVMSITDSPAYGKTTWFAATERYFAEFGPTVLREMRRAAASSAAKHGPITTIAYCAEENVQPWFEAMGYKYVSDLAGDLKIFLYEPRSS